MINVTLIQSNGSPVSFQAEDFPEFLRLTEQEILRGESFSYLLSNPIVRVFAYNTQTKQLDEYTHDGLLALCDSAREMFRPRGEDSGG